MLSKDFIDLISGHQQHRQQQQQQLEMKMKCSTESKGLEVH
jgi:hypothetical protein